MKEEKQKMKIRTGAMQQFELLLGVTAAIQCPQLVVTTLLLLQSCPCTLGGCR